MVGRRVFEAASRTLPLMALFFIPILFAMPTLFLWARPEVVAGDTILQAKAPYLNVTVLHGPGGDLLRLLDRSARCC